MKNIPDFRTQVDELGLYPTLACECIRIAKSRHVKVPGSSTVPRFQSHNKTQLLTDDEWKNKMETMISSCNQLRDELALNVLRPKPSLAHTTKKKSKKKARADQNKVVKRKPHDTICADFLKQIQKEGFGIGRVFSVAFFQLSSLFGFIPVSLVSWSSIGSTHSGGYKFLKFLDPDVTPGLAQTYFFTEALQGNLRMECICMTS